MPDAGGVKGVLILMLALGPAAVAVSTDAVMAPVQVIPLLPSGVHPAYPDPPPFTSSHPAAVTEVHAGAAVPEGALQTYSLWAVVSVKKSPGRLVATLPGAEVPKNF